MTQAIERRKQAEPVTIEQALVLGDLSKLDPEQRVNLYNRIVARVSIDLATGCWLWTGAKTAAGYGEVKVRGSVVPQYTHRIVYMLSRGSIPAGLTLDHLCRNRACVDPDHLEIVTRAENVARGESMSARHARATHCQRGHVKSAASTYVYPDGRTECRPCRVIRWLEFKSKKA